MSRPGVFAAAGLAAAAFASLAGAQPAGVRATADGMTDAAGDPLYVFKWDTMKGMSHCEGPCAKAWPPLLAPSGAKPSGDWSLVMRGDGAVQWAYKDKPLYSYAKDTPGKPATGVSENWTLAK